MIKFVFSILIGLYLIGYFTNNNESDQSLVEESANQSITVAGTVVAIGTEPVFTTLMLRLLDDPSTTIPIQMLEDVSSFSTGDVLKIKADVSSPIGVDSAEEKNFISLSEKNLDDGKVVEVISYFENEGSENSIETNNTISVTEAEELENLGEANIHDESNSQKVSSTKIEEVILLNDTEQLAVRLDNGMDPNKECSEADGSCIMFASQVGNVEALRLLLSYGGNPNVIVNEITPLLFSIIGDNVPAVKVLLENGADPNFAFHEDASPLIMATHQGNQKIIKLLQAAGGHF